MGKAIVHLLPREGAYVNIVDLKGGEEVRNELDSLGIHIEVFSIDITSKKEVGRVVREFLDRHGKVDILVNAAGIMGLGLTEDIEEEDWDRTMAINLKGVLFFCQAVIPTMKKQRSGKIVPIGSLNAKGIDKARGDYKASKAGIHALTMAIAREAVPFNINVNVNAIAPKLVLTPMPSGLPEVMIEEAKKSIPLGRAGTPEDVTNAMLCLDSEKSSYIIGHILDLNGGSS